MQLGILNPHHDLMITAVALACAIWHALCDTCAGQTLASCSEQGDKTISKVLKEAYNLQQLGEAINEKIPQTSWPLSDDLVVRRPTVPAGTTEKQRGPTLATKNYSSCSDERSTIKGQDNCRVGT